VIPRPQQSGAILVIHDKTIDYLMVEMGKDFVANASHELRTPITIIRGFAETLQDIPHLSSKMLQEITEKIIKTCGRLNHLVKSLLVLADVDNISSKNFSRINLVSCLERCSHMFLSVYPQVMLQTHYELEEAWILADGDLLDLAIMNLLENSIKYSNPPAKVALFLERQKGLIAFSVTDRGIGIPEADLPYIFNRFYRVDKARSRKSGGAGLGLSIVKTIVEKHKGSLNVASEVGVGSTFTVFFKEFSFS
jgi:signal transduction histidine kinase